MVSLDFDPGLCRNESEVEGKFIISYLLPALGFSPHTWYQQVALGKSRLDFFIFTAKYNPFMSDRKCFQFSFVIEAKHPKENLNRHISQLKNYLTVLNVRYGILTNGKELRIYENTEGKAINIFECKCPETPKHISQIKSLINISELIKVSRKPARAVPKLRHKNFSRKGRISMNKKIAVYHNKGGVGKTTVVTNLAAALSRKGKKILVIDLDSQANTTFATGLIKFSEEKGDDIKDNNILKIMRRVSSAHIQEVIKKSQFNTPEVDIIPSHIQLLEKEYELVMERNAELLFSDNLKFIEDQYDVILIDTPPSLNLYARTALVVADYLIIPSDLKPFANQGLPNVKKFIESTNETRRHIGKEPVNVLGILPSKVPNYSKFVIHTLPGRMERVKAEYGIDIMDTCIFQREILAQCTDNHERTDTDIIPNPKSVFDFKPNSPSAKEFESLADEIMKKCGLGE